MKKICIILINWNSFEDTKECVNSLFDSTYQNFDVIVVDNNSIIKPNFNDERVKCIYLKDNLGFAGANNIGIKYALENKYEYIWILNNDTVIAKDALSILNNFAVNTGYPVLTNLILHYDNRELIWYAGGHFSRILGKGVHHYANCNVNKVKLKRENTEFVTGCSIFIKTEIFEHIGLFDENLFAYSEDLEFSMKLKAKGYNILFIPEAVIYHKVGKSFKNNNTISEGRSSPIQVYLFTRNRIVVSKRYLSKVNFTFFILWFIPANFLKAFLLFLIGRKKKSKMLFKAVIDWIRL